MSLFTFTRWSISLCFAYRPCILSTFDTADQRVFQTSFEGCFKCDIADAISLRDECNTEWNVISIHPDRWTAGSTTLFSRSSRLDHMCLQRCTRLSRFHLVRGPVSVPTGQQLYGWHRYLEHTRLGHIVHHFGHHSQF